MSESRGESEAPGADGTPPEAVAAGAQWHPLATAAIIGGAVAATAGAYLGTRALARRNGGGDGKPVNSVLATAITALSLTPKKEESQPSAAEIIVGRPTRT